MVHAVHVSGLPRQCTDKEVQHHMQVAGTGFIVRVQMKGAGNAVVYFDNDRDAADACRPDTSIYVKGQLVTVRRYAEPLVSFFLLAK